MSGHSLPEGYVLAEKYRLDALIGHGGMGEVWKAEHLGLKSWVAIKVIHTDRVVQDEVLARFKREAQAAFQLRGAHIVQIFDFGVENGAPYMVMELLEGESLAKRIAQVGRLSPMETATIISHVARAIGKAHEAGIIHRDLKPENVFLTYGDGELVAKVLDFGIAKFQNPSADIREASTRTGAILGTPFYMSPEQAEGLRNIDYRADIWSLGVIAFECLVGRRPFDGDALGEVLLKICARPMPVPSNAAAVPAGFDAWFAKAANRELAERFPSAREAAAELTKICSSAATTAMPMMPDARPVPAHTPDPMLHQSGGSIQTDPRLAAIQTGNPLVPQGDSLWSQTGDPPPAHPLTQSGTGRHLGQTGGPLARTLEPRSGPSPALIAAAVLIGAVLVIGLPLGAWAAFKHRAAARAESPASSASFGTQEAAGGIAPPPPTASEEVAPPEPPPDDSAEPAPSSSAEKPSASRVSTGKGKSAPAPAKSAGTPGSSKIKGEGDVY